MATDLLERLVRDFEAAEQSTSEARQWSQGCRDYYDSKQYTDAELATFRQRRQPPITINRVKPKIDFLLGLERKQRNDPKAFPREPGDQHGADAATDGIRYVCEDNHFDGVRSDVFENTLIEGTGGSDISVVPAPDGSYKIVITHMMWDRIYFDPHSRRKDFSDARYVGQVLWFDLDEAIARWPESSEIFNSTMSAEMQVNDTYEDRPQNRWADPQRKRIRVCEEWYRDDKGAIKQCLFTKAGIISEKDSPYVDEEGNPEWPFELTSAFVDRDGNRYGVVKAWIDIQDEINKRRSKGLHIMSVRQLLIEKGAVDDVEKARRELAKPDGVIEKNPGMEFEILETADLAAAQFQLLQEAKNEIDAVGVNAALSGTEGRVMSGRALIARQEGGMAELGPIFDQLRMWQLRVYRKVWNRIRQYWTAEKWVRVTDDENAPKYVGLNVPVTRLEAEIERAKAAGMVPPQLQQLAQMPKEQIAQIAPEMLQVVEVKNAVGELDVDIILAEVPDTVAIQAEQFDALMQMVPAAAAAGERIPFSAIVKASTLRNKEDILKEMKGGDENGVPPQVAAQIQAAQAEIQAASQEVAKREEAAKAAEQQMKDAAHALELQKVRVQAEETELALKRRIFELETQSIARAVTQPQPATVQ